MVSIIVPVYNVAPYLSKCLDSLLAQQGADIEVLAINDGSTDRSDKILEEYVLRYSNVRVFTQSNQGVSAARNVGLEHVRGDYVMFVDPDDWLEPRAVSRLLELMKEQPCDMIGFNYYAVNESDGTREVYKRIKQTQYYDLSDDRQYTAMFEEHGLRTVVCDSFFKRDILRRLRFECYPNGEDTLFSFMALLRVHSILFISDPLYNYFRRSGTASMCVSLRKELSVLNVMLRCTQEVELCVRLEPAKLLLIRKLRCWLLVGEALVFSLFHKDERRVFVDEWIITAKKISKMYNQLQDRSVSFFACLNIISPPIFIVAVYCYMACIRQFLAQWRRKVLMP